MNCKVQLLLHPNVIKAVLMRVDHILRFNVAQQKSSVNCFGNKSLKQKGLKYDAFLYCKFTFV